MNPGDLAAWVATALFPSTALAGLLLRRLAKGAFSIRLRPHFVLGYVVFGLALLHTAVAMAGMRALSSVDLWLATLALFGLGLQTFFGMSLQAPGVYRVALRRCHLVMTWSVAAFIAGHVLLAL